MKKPDWMKQCSGENCDVCTSRHNKGTGDCLEFNMKEFTPVGIQDEYVGWCSYYDGKIIRLCDSDSEGAFRIYHQRTINKLQITIKTLSAERDAAQIQNKFLAQEILIVREENRLLKEEFLERGAVWQDFIDRGQIPKVQGKPNPILPEESQEEL